MPSAEFPEVPKESRYLLQSMERGPGGQRRPTYVYYDKWLYETLRLHPENYDFDPRVRPWFVEATAAPDLIRTSPMSFSRPARSVRPSPAPRRPGPWLRPT